MLGHADYTASTRRQHELDHIEQEHICFEMSRSLSGNRWSVLGVGLIGWLVDWLVDWLVGWLVDVIGCLSD